MYSRVVTFTGAQDIDAGVAFVREKVAPVLHEQHGFRGLTVSVDRSAGLVGVLSVWESEADRDASESAMVKAREEGHAVIGGTMTVEMFEEMVIDVVEAPKVGSPLLVRRVTMDPAKVEQNVEFFKREVLPQIKANPGFCAARNMIDRQTGSGIVGTVWADTASLEAAAAAAETRRGQAAQHGVNLGEQSRREIVFLDMP
jgi:heme-degrading monooxygenase HmoA